MARMGGEMADSKPGEGGDAPVTTIAGVVSRPEANDRAQPIAYGDFILMSCLFDTGGSAYLCEDGCVVMDTDVEMRTSSRELVFEVCIARDARALVDMHEFLRKRGMPVGFKPIRQLSAKDEVLWQRLVYHRETEERNNEIQAQQMAGRSVTFGDRISLRQVKSTMFLGVDIGQAPKIEPLTKRLLLLSQPSAPMTFRILPRYRYLVEGNTVCYGDQVTLLSADFAQEEYVHVSQGFTKTDVGIVHEVNLSHSGDTSWNIECFFQHAQKSATHVKAGDVVRLYHPYHDAYVSANYTDDTVCLQRCEGSLSSTMWVVGEDNVLTGGSVRSNVSYTFMQLVTRKYLLGSSEVLWPSLQLQSDDPDVTQGHEDSSSLFTAIQTKATRGGHGSMFTIEPIEKEQDGTAIRWGSRFHLRHASTKRFVHCIQSHLLKEPLRGMQGDALTFHGDNGDDSMSDTTGEDLAVPDLLLVNSPAFFREDSFDIVKVPEEQVHAVDTLATILPALVGYHAALRKMVQAESPDFPVETLLDVVDSLNDMQAYVYTASRASFVDEKMGKEEDRAPIAFCQNFMRDLRVPGLIMSVLQLSCIIMRKQYSFNMLGVGDDWKKVTLVDLVREKVLESVRNRSVKMVLKLCYQVLVTIVRKHKENAVHMSNYLDDIQEQLVLKLGAGDVLFEMLDGNTALLKALSEDPSKERLIHFHLAALLDHGKDAMHLRYLSCLVASGDKGIERHQDVVLPFIVENADKVLLQVRLFHQAVQLRDAAGEDHGIIGLPSQWQDLGLIATGSKRPGDKGMVHKAMLEYWVESLQLLATMCKAGASGRRDFVVRKVQKLVPLDIGLICMQDDGLPDHLRRNMCELIRVVYVENDEFLKVTRPTAIVFWKDLAASERFPSARWEPIGGKGMDSEQSKRILADLKNAIRNYFSQHHCQYYPGEPYANELKLAMVRLSRQLTLFGYYDETELEGVIQDARSVLDFATLRFRDDGRQALAAGPWQEEGGEDDANELLLSEQTVSAALRLLRPLCGSFPPMEVARLRSSFRAKVFDAGSTMVEAGASAGDFFVLQSGMAFMILANDAVEVVTDTVGPGGTFGLDTLRGPDNSVWPWRVRALHRVTALHITRAAFKAATEYIAQGGDVPLTDGLEVVLESKRIACSLLNDVYNLRLRVRCAKLLQEYRFDLNISHRKYYAAQTSKNTFRFPLKGDNAQNEIVTEFDHRMFRRLPRAIRRRVKPLQYVFFGLVRIDRAVAFIALVQYIIAVAIITLLVRSSELKDKSPHPGPSSADAVIVNIIATGALALSTIGLGVAAFTHSAFLARMCTAAQLLYLGYYTVNTAVGVLVAILNMVGGSGSEAELIAQVVWLFVLTPMGCYSCLAAASLSVHLRTPAYFVVARRAEERREEDEDEELVPRREFTKMLEIFDLDEDGALSRSLADLIISPHLSLVIDSFSLLVRTHRSQVELHRALCQTLLLADDDARQLDDNAESLTYQLLGVTNDMQAYVVERLAFDARGLSRSEAAMRLEPLLRSVRHAEPLLNEMIGMIADSQPNAATQRKLFQCKGVHLTLLRLLRSIPVDYHETTAPLCYTALAGVCNKCEEVQNDLAANIDVLYTHFESLPRQVTLLLSAMYVDNVDLCYHVEDRLIERVVSMLHADMHACYLVFLRVIISPAGEVVRRNQNIVCKYLDREGIDLRLQSDAEIKDLSSARRNDVRACYVTSLELLVACMAKGNHENKIKCRGGSANMTLTLREISSALSMKETVGHSGKHGRGRIKMALLRFVEEAYICAEGPDAIINMLSHEMYDVLDQYARMIEALLIDSEGSRVSGLKGSHRQLMLEAYPNVVLTYFSKVHAHQVFQPETGRLGVAVRMCEAMGELVNGGRKDLEPKDELRLVQVLHVIWNMFGHKDPRLTAASRLKRGGSGLEANMAEALGWDEDEMHFTRSTELRLQVAKLEEMELSTALDVQDGVLPFANEFLELMTSSGPSESEKLMKAFSSGFEGEGEFSNQHMKSLVKLLCSPRLSKSMQRTGLSILMQVMDLIPYPSIEEVILAGDAIKWLTEGVPQMVIELISLSDPASTDDDDVVAEGLNVAILLLEKGKKHVQDAFYALFKADENTVIFQSIRERLVRAERGITAVIATFDRVAAEMDDECGAHGHALTLEGVTGITKEDRTCVSFLGSHAGKLLRFLQLLCEGHNRDMQEYMRWQGKSSTDMVTCTADFLSVASRHICPATMGLIIQCVDTLIEFVQNPCYSNQKVLVDTQLPHVVNNFLQMTSELPINFDDHADYIETISTLKTKSVTLLLSLLERVDDPFVPERILKALEIDRLIDIMNALREGYLGEDAEQEDDEEGQIEDDELSENGSFQVACSFFMLFMMLKYYDSTDELAHKCNKAYIKDIRRLRANCGFIEISRGGRLERVFFQIPSVCRYLTRSAKDSILRQVNRDNHQDQMLDFVDRGQVRYEEMLHFQDLQSSMIYRLFSNLSVHIDLAFFLNAIIINIIILFAYHYKDNQFVTLQTMSNIVIDGTSFQLLMAFTIIQLMIGLARIVLYYLQYGVLRVKRMLREGDHPVLESEYGGPRYYFHFWLILLTDGYFFLLFVYAATSAAALTLQGSNILVYFLMGIHLTDMFILFPALRNVVKAVSERANTLLQTTGLGFIMMFIYSAIGFVFFADKFEFEEAEIQDGYRQQYNVNSARCDTIWKCFIVTVDMGLRKGDIGSAIDDVQWRDLFPGTYVSNCESVPGLEYLGCMGIYENDVSPLIFLRIVYTSTFFIFIDTILVNIIFGVIIDTFSDLREQNEEMEAEMEHRCFICGVERYRFEINSRDGNGFERHIKEDHNMWTYVYFIVYLMRKDVDEHTGFESYVFEQLNELDEDGNIQKRDAPDVTWFPCNVAMVLKDALGANQMNDLTNRVKNLSHGVSAFASHATNRIQTVMSALERRRTTRKVMMSSSSSEASSEVSSNGTFDFDPEALLGQALQGTRDVGQRMLEIDRTGVMAVGAGGVLNVAQGFFSGAAMGLASVGGGLGIADTAPRVEVEPDGYERELEWLANEGYDNRNLNVRLLEEHGGDIYIVADVLAGGTAAAAASAGTAAQQIPQPAFSLGGSVPRLEDIAGAQTQAGAARETTLGSGGNGVRDGGGSLDGVMEWT